MPTCWRTPANRGSGDNSLSRQVDSAARRHTFPVQVKVVPSLTDGEFETRTCRTLRDESAHNTESRSEYNDTKPPASLEVCTIDMSCPLSLVTIILRALTGTGMLLNLGTR